MDDIQALRADYEAALLRIPGVVGVGTGENEAGESVLLVYTSQAAEEVAAALPQALADLPLQFMFVGNLKAQDLEK